MCACSRTQGRRRAVQHRRHDLHQRLLSNTAAVFALTALVLMVPLGLEAMLVGITATMISYVLLTLRYRHLVRAAWLPT